MNLSKKDLIIIALFINLGILTVLISLATSSSPIAVQKVDSQPLSEQKEYMSIVSPEVKKESLPVKEQKVASFDEIDQILEEYIPIDDSMNAALNQKESVQKSDPIKTPEKSKKKTEGAQSKKVLTKMMPKPSVTPLIPKPTAKKEEPKQEEQFYTVQPGDNPWKIAKKFHISTEKLLEWNNLTEKRARNLKVGERLRIQEERR